VTSQPDDDDGTFLDVEGLGVLSRAAFQLHSFAVVNSIRDRHPGFVSDDYLNAISAETTVTAMELQAAGMWDRRDCGYFIIADDMVRWAVNHNEHQDRLAAACEARGLHVPSDAEAGWIVCSDCGVPLQRSDGGPVALPDGGRLGPDPRLDDAGDDPEN